MAKFVLIFCQSQSWRDLGPSFKFWVFGPCKGIRTPRSRTFFLWNPESLKYLLVELRNVEAQTIGMGKQRIRNPECGVQNPRLFWIPLYGQGGLPTLAAVEESG